MSVKLLLSKLLFVLPAAPVLILAFACMSACAGELPLPAFFDAREIGKAPEVKSQGKSGTCWAISASSGVEAALMPEEHLVFSADHIALNNGFTGGPDDGGDYRMIMAYLASRRGPVMDSEDPYGDGESPDGLEAAVWVKEMRLFEDTDREIIKKAIMQWGPVQTSLCMDRRMTASSRDYYNEETFGFYCPENRKVTHDILILGWDDEYAADNFKTVPSADGAWICQNTWGEKFGDGGIFYVSYEDPNMAQNILAFTRIEMPDEEILCQNDPCGWIGRIGYEDETCCFANVYTAPEAGTLSSFGFYAVGPDTSYELFAGPGFGGGFDFNSLTACGSGHLDDTGYYTITPSEPIYIEKGQEFAVAVKITTKGAKKPAAVELKKDEYTADVTLANKNSYLSHDGKEWQQTQKEFGTNICLKAGITPAGEEDAR